MNFQIEVPSRGPTYAGRLHHYDNMMGCMVRGFSFRVLRVWVRFVWRTSGE